MQDQDKIVITRTFDASREALWKSWTDAEEIKKWWGPEGFYAPSVKVDFHEGGNYIFGMHGPAGTKYDNDSYSGGVYLKIIPMERIIVKDYFTDKNGNMIDPTTVGLDPNFPKESKIEVLFEDGDPGKSKLTIIYPAATSELTREAIKKSGMVDGWNSSLNKLAKILER